MNDQSEHADMSVRRTQLHPYDQR